jgi:hypothetical protein
LLWLTLLFLEVTSYQDIKKLIRSTEFDIGFDHHRVPALHDWILNFMRMNGLLLVDPGAEIFAL